MTNFEVTDPAMELSELLRVILSVASSNKPTWLTLSKALGLDAANEEYSDFLAAVLARISGLRSIAATATGSPRLTERAARVMSTADRLAHVFLPSGQAAPWSDSHGRLSLSDGMNLANFSPEARAARPLRLVEPSERDAFLKQINEAINEVEANTGIDPWLKAALLREAARLRTTLEHIDYFGHEFAAERTAVLATKAAEVAQKTSKTSALNLAKTYHLIMGLAAVFIVPHEVSEAAQTYLKWGNELIPGIVFQPGSPSSEDAVPNSLGALPALPKTQKT